MTDLSVPPAASLEMSGQQIARTYNPCLVAKTGRSMPRVGTIFDDLTLCDHHAIEGPRPIDPMLSSPLKPTAPPSLP